MDHEHVDGCCNFVPENAERDALASWSRREFLKAAGIAGVAAAIPSFLANRAFAGGAPNQPKEMKTKHLVFVGLAGGVRSKETVLAPDNVPNLMKLAERGVMIPRVRTRNVGHYGALLSLFTGCVEVMGIRENTRGKNPTLFEYLRRSGKLRAEQVWLSTSGGPQQANLAYSLDKRYGADYQASLIDSEGLFNQEFKGVLDRFGRPKDGGEKEAAETERLSKAMGEEPGEAARVEKFIMDEINKQTAKVTGPGARDAKALRLGTTILQVFRPSVLGIALQNADVAHGSYNGYVDVIRRNDEEIGRLMAAIDRDPQLRDSTAVIVCPEFGRDKDLNQRNGLDHGDNSDELLKISAVAYGPDFKKGKKIDTEMDWIDITPTICHMFGAKAEAAEGKVAKELFA
ncbi:MAG TPA: twin-arginine translocation signal domain-containing protein [Planctomycetota bacterium]|nr:twin-arginine translocation signal domain-containing protein [Planctomycetota bacterium]